MTHTQRTTLALVLACVSMFAVNAWMRPAGAAAQAAPAAAVPMTRAERFGCHANDFSTVHWIGIANGKPQVGMGRVALLCTLGEPDDVRTVTTSQGETEWQTFRRDGQRPLVVQISGGVVEVIAD